jgi:hypothetical protein
VSAGFTEVAKTFNVCGGANFALCASVQVSVLHNGQAVGGMGMVTMTVSNLSTIPGGPGGDLFTKIGILSSGGYFQATNLVGPAGWWVTGTLDNEVDFGVRAIPANPGLAAGAGDVTFSFRLMGDFSTFDLAGTNLTINGEPGGLPGGGGPGDGGPITQTPEPGTLLLLGTGMAGIAGMRRRRRDREA